MSMTKALIVDRRIAEALRKMFPLKINEDTAKVFRNKNFYMTENSGKEPIYELTEKQFMQAMEYGYLISLHEVDKWIGNAILRCRYGYNMTDEQIIEEHHKGFTNGDLVELNKLSAYEMALYILDGHYINFNLERRP